MSSTATMPPRGLRLPILRNARNAHGSPSKKLGHQNVPVGISLTSTEIFPECGIDGGEGIAQTAQSQAPPGLSKTRQNARRASKGIQIPAARKNAAYGLQMRPKGIRPDAPTPGHRPPPPKQGEGRIH